MNSTRQIDTAFILAAGRGERMRPLTDRIPKPLVLVAGKTLLQRHFENLLKAGIRRVVVNHAHLGEQITEFLTALNTRLGMPAQLIFSAEPEGGLETAGGIIKALPLIDRERFIVINGDIWIDYHLESLLKKTDASKLAHLVLVPTPDYKPGDDFFLDDNGDIASERKDGLSGYTFSGLSILNRTLFDGVAPGKSPLAPLFRRAMEADQVTAEVYTGEWCDVGTVERLKQLRKKLNHGALSDN